MKIFYGTSNPGKLQNLQSILYGMPVELITPLDLKIKLPQVDEIGATPLENARIKASAYYSAVGIPCFALDSGLFFQGFSDSEQPGPYVRRVNGNYLSDTEFISYYSELAHIMGGRIKARFVNGLCAIWDDNRCKEVFGPQVATDWFWIVEKPSNILIKGFPMDSIAVDPRTGLYWAQIEQKDKENAKGASLAVGIRRFFSELLEENFCHDIRSVGDDSI